MSEHPILFSSVMIRALLAGTKTQTRRIISAPPPPEAVSAGVLSSPTLSNGLWWWLDSDDLEDASAVGDEFRCPYGLPGDTLWVRETFCDPCGDRQPLYRADVSALDLDEERAVRRLAPGLSAAYAEARWKPSIFMPRWASRITLEITDVRVERLQNISEDDAIAEGISWAPGVQEQNVRKWGVPQTARMAYADAWDTINGRRARWESNPFVWVVSFRRVLPAEAAA